MDWFESRFEAADQSFEEFLFCFVICEAEETLRRVKELMVVTGTLQRSQPAGVSGLGVLIRITPPLTSPHAAPDALKRNYATMKGIIYMAADRLTHLRLAGRFYHDV